MGTSKGLLGAQPTLGLDALNERRAKIAQVHQELRQRHGTPLYLALALYQSSGRGVEVGQGHLFKWPAALNPLFPGLREVGQLTAGSPSQPSAPHPRSGGRTRGRDQRLNRAVERHAVAVATAWYQALGYTVEDVGSRSPGIWKPPSLVSSAESKSRAPGLLAMPWISPSTRSPTPTGGPPRT